MSKEPKRNVYVGHRYVPLVIGEWEKTETYEGLSIVTYQGTSYTSKKRVPKGIDILNEEYWVVTGNYNAQIEEYRKDVRELEKSVEKDINDLETDVNQNIDGFKTDVTNNMNEFKETTNNKITKIETDTTEAIEKNKNELTSEIKANKNMLDNKIDYLVNDWNMTQVNIQPRYRKNDDSYVAVQGSCYLGGSGNNLEYAMAFIPINQDLNNQAIILNTNLNRFIDYTGGNKLDLFHANGMDLNKDTDTIYVSHANTQINEGESISNNDVSEVSKDGSKIIRVIKPKGLPSNRRIKYFTYDKKTGKKYVGDDEGIFEVDNDLNILKNIDFSDEFLNYKTWGLGQVAIVHNDLIFYLVMGGPTIAVFDIAGKLLKLHDIPKFTKEGVFAGTDPNGLFFDDDDNLYLVTGSQYSSYKMTDYITRVFKMNPFKSVASNNFIGSHNTRTVNNIYVDPNQNNPFTNGSTQYPFISLDEAVTYILTSDYQKGFQNIINLKKGHYNSSDIRSNGAKITIKGESGVEIDALRFYSTDVILTDLEINDPDNNYTALHGVNSKIILDGVKINAKNKTSGVFLEQGSELYANSNDKINEIINCERAIYANASTVIGSKESYGIENHERPIVTSESGFAPQLLTE